MGHGSSAIFVVQTLEMECLGGTGLAELLCLREARGLDSASHDDLIFDDVDQGSSLLEQFIALLVVFSDLAVICLALLAVPRRQSP